jgi:hypothetical protein
MHSPDQENEPIELYRIEDQPRKAKSASADRTWILEDVATLRAFALGYVKGTTRAAAMFIIALFCITLHVPLDTLRPALIQQMQLIKVVVHPASPSENLMRSLGVSHDHVRQKPHVLYWIRAVPRLVVSNLVRGCTWCTVWARLP